MTNAIKVGLVGCGGRGSGAASQALAADDYTELTAVADIDQAQIDHCLQVAQSASPRSRARVKVGTRHASISGLDAFQKVIDSKVDVVLLATPPGFRPQHLAACIAANKHVFCEKPVSTDAPGVRSVMQTADQAKQKNLSLVAGFCWRYNNMIQDTFQQVESGAIGRLVAYYATYYTNPVKPMPPASTRPAGMSDVEWQIRNWYNFVWLCGDSLVEQAVHSVDKIAWAMHDEPPVSCVGVGGRAIPAEGGNIYDHFEINYLYPNGVRAFMANRQIVGCYNENSDYMLGTEGTCTIGKGPPPRIAGKDQLDLQRAAIRHVSEGARPAVRLHPQEPADERRQAHGHQHPARHHGPHGRLHRPGSHLGPGAELDRRSCSPTTWIGMAASPSSRAPNRVSPSCSNAMRTGFPLALAAGILSRRERSSADRRRTPSAPTCARSTQRITDRQPERPRKSGPYKVTIPSTTVAYDMVPIPAGEFTMGSPATDPRTRRTNSRNTKSASMPSGCRRTK